MNRFENAPLPVYSALLGSLFGDEKEAKEADEYLRDIGLRDQAGDPACDVYHIYDVRFIPIYELLMSEGCGRVQI